VIEQQLINPDNYRSFPAVSNSDLSTIEKLLSPPSRVIDLETAYANGTLIDAMITEPLRVNYFKYRVDGEPYQYTVEEFERSEEMKKAFYRDPFCVQMVKQCSFQKISYVPQFKIVHDGISFTVDAKAKWDLFCDAIDLGGDIKSTACTTQKQCEEALRYFSYDRSRAWYMDLEKRNNDILIFISKVNFKIFKVPVKRDSELFKEGKVKYRDLAFKYWSLFSNIKRAA
jgi:hypothetical protein